ncbi:MAG: hypothetical protein RLZZ63_1414 [Gemmatimonadota bacterium]|jgi:prepilin-type N-terminal cleavage/methylation domain-containing protein
MTARRAFTLAELLVAIVVLGIVGLGVSRLMMSQMRFFASTAGQRDARSVSRNALNIVRDEMRMIEPRGIVLATSTAFQVRVPYAMGVYCAANTAIVAPVDSLAYASAVFQGYAYRDTAVNASYQYVASTSAPAAGSTSTCTGAPVSISQPHAGWRILALDGGALTLPAGAPVLLYQTITYELAASSIVSGRTALWRRVAGGTDEEIAVPFENTAIFRFYVAGSTSPQDAVPADISRITGLELVLVGESERRASNRATPETAPVRLSIFFRNAVY